MKWDNWLSVTKHRFPKASSTFCFLVCCLALTTFFSCAISAIKGTAEMVGFVKGMTAQLEEREIYLRESAKKPLTENQAELLTQLLQEEKSLDMVLSSERYLTYLEKQVGTTYSDYLAYLDTLPTTEQKSATRFALTEILPSVATTGQIQLCTNFYFKFRKKIANEPDITSDSKKMEEFMRIHLVEPLMDMYSSEISSSEMIEIMKISSVPGAMAVKDTDVFLEIWLGHLEKYGSREGMLRCAISTPDEFALMRSFFPDVVALEKWIMNPIHKK